VRQDQVRVGAAVSELSRELVRLEQPCFLVLSLAGGSIPALVVEAEWTGRLGGAFAASDPSSVEGVAAAARLMDTCHLVGRADGGTVTLTKTLPPGGPSVTAARLVELRTAEAAKRADTALEVLHSQDQDLADAMDSLRLRQEELERANLELEETNRGVVALYAELNDATARLQEASESKTRFWASVGHELRTPLNSVLGLSRLLLDAGSDPLTEAQRTQVELIRDSGSMLLAMVADLLDVAKAESGRVEPRFELVDLTRVLEELRASMLPLATTPTVELLIDEPHGAGPLRTDPELLGQVLRNLVSNALKFTERGTVRCRAHVTADHVELVVTDTGIGIPPEHLSKVQEEFYQVPGPLQVRGGGTGLGLAYSRRVAGILGGELLLSSEVGEGTSAVVRLPTDPQRTDVARFASVLIVDDDAAFRTVLRGALVGIAERVEEVGDGASALRRLVSGPVGLVLLDLEIPPPTGSAVLAAMRRDPGLRAIPVVVVTSMVPVGARRAELDSTAAVIDKEQFSPELLRAAIAIATQLTEGAR
jgi:signal transduction histidine kinase